MEVGLIKEQQTWTSDDPDSDVETASLPARELGGDHLPFGPQPDHVDQLICRERIPIEAYS